MRADLIERLRRGELVYMSSSGPVYRGPTALETEAADALASQEPIAFLDQDGKLSVIEGSPLAEMLKSLPPAKVGKPLLALFASPVVPVAAKAEAEGWPEIAEHFRRGMLDAEDILNRVPLEAAPAIDLKAVAMSRASDRLRQARHDMIYKYGPGYLNAAPTGKGDGQP